jgi:hypothetical protein
MSGEIKLPENLQSSEIVGFNVLRKFMADMFGPEYIDKCVKVAKPEFAKCGVWAWEPTDANVVADVSPMPAPWLGQWGFRLRFCAILADGDIHVIQFYVPSSTIPKLKVGDFSGLQ